MDTDSQDAATPAATPAALAGIWRRWAAFLIDWVILSLGGFIAGLVLFDVFVAMGVWTRVMGFAIATTYFGIFDSGWGGASSPGKKVLGIRVVDNGGRVIGMPRAFLRAALICAPLILNSFYAVRQGDYAHLAVNGLFGGWMVGSLYMLAFNRGTRQGLHDLATRTFVIRGRATRLGLSGYRFWRPHLMIVLGIFALLLPVALAGLPIFLHFAPGSMMRAEKVPVGPVEVVNAKLSWKLRKGGAGGKPECRAALVYLTGPGIDDASLARKVAMALVARSPCQVVTNLSVRMQYGYDMGFSSGTAYRDYLIDEADMTAAP
ncbi:RDD family protein [Luteibacter yeojuensis]|uniref:RDD domain-containing protein n=1 Tax=Luteibacter yeojuensis TaxID=345309 RepID=A0A0F3K9W2_9GAMM|nr:RDD family protein [Luteibacter yeojuensis]KJV27767.1 hypothetical protein VI08_17530 [Luteibacter yeojuensis]